MASEAEWAEGKDGLRTAPVLPCHGKGNQCLSEPAMGGSGGLWARPGRVSGASVVNQGSRGAPFSAPAYVSVS